MKGLLLFSYGNFFQVIEGETAKVNNLWQKIKKDDRHKSIIKIFEEKK
ncbi:BLUF domain-containing protein [Mesonia mobilis]|nr:BLUF domain-containing protein [Aquimarina celericrescens]